MFESPDEGSETMQIAVASGKGGTGKTTVATNLAYVASAGGSRWAYVDCDVEEPNGAIFLKPVISKEQTVGKTVPEVETARCTQCGQCGEICQYSAIVCVGDSPLVFPELCHACGGCSLVCPEDAIHEVLRPIGRLRIGASGPIRFVDGVLNVGEHMSPPAIHAVKQAAPEADFLLLDSPPGTSCPVVEAVRGSDLVVLVTEPTPFGLNDLKLAVEMVRALKLPLGVVINRADLANGEMWQYCARTRIPVLGEIPDDRAVAEAYSRGELACEAVAGYRELFEELLNRILAATEKP
jgi:MinD superfamily P-loop ATPase